ncbi:hypothetical protein OBBRIDRAFT_804199 [Obba rivulosa]|uniref:Uncharacterized protein n=1 Tax=Obba rivulosa TaxID=1052685 RepID=A0A8E2ASF7_9APHY|nr:hypothetical protein OBBRIDRAFT_804199 [Obba rivulosa]
MTPGRMGRTPCLMIATLDRIDPSYRLSSPSLDIGGLAGCLHCNCSSGGRMTASGEQYNKAKEFSSQLSWLRRSTILTSETSSTKKDSSVKPLGPLSRHESVGVKSRRLPPGALLTSRLQTLWRSFKRGSITGPNIGQEANFNGSDPEPERNDLGASLLANSNHELDAQNLDNVAGSPADQCPVGGWVREQTIADLLPSKGLAAREIRLAPSAYRKLLARTPLEIVAQHFGVNVSVLRNIPQKDPYILPSKVPPPQLGDAEQETIKDPQARFRCHVFHLHEQPKQMEPGGGGWIKIQDSDQLPRLDHAGERPGNGCTLSAGLGATAFAGSSSSRTSGFQMRSSTIWLVLLLNDYRIARRYRFVPDLVW